MDDLSRVFLKKKRLHTKSRGCLTWMSVLDLESDLAKTAHFCALPLVFRCIHCKYRWAEILLSLVHTHKRTIENTDLSLEMVPFITALEIAYSCLADSCADLDWYGAVRGRAANKCEGRPLFSSSLSLFLLSAKRRSQLGLQIVASPPHKGWCDCRAFQRAETRALSEDPLLHLLPAFLSFLCRCLESLLAPVCSVCFCSLLSSPGCFVCTSYITVDFLSQFRYILLSFELTLACISQYKPCLRENCSA